MISNIFEIKWPGWETVQLIGKGSFGAVYKIQRDVLGEYEQAALKVISIPKDTNDIDELYSEGFDDESITNKYEEHLKSIIAEYTMMRKMSDCVNVVNCDDIHYERQENGIGWNIYIKMELLTPLLKALDNEISEKEVIRLGKDICKALCACQKLKIIHRDIKPQNIFLSANGDYKLGDFGIAKAVEKTSYGTYAGTEKYMAPEVYANKPYGASADIYSLGLVLYWMLNNRRLPFLPADTQKITFSMDEDAQKHRLSGEKIPAPMGGSIALKEIVLKACAFNPADRYSSAEEMLTALDNIGLQKKEINKEINSNNTSYSADEIANKFLNYIVLNFNKKNNVDLFDDKIALQRISEAVNKNISRLKQGDRIKISLPYITSSEKEPLHLETIISINDISDSSKKMKNISNMTINEMVKAADNGNTKAMLEIICLYCIEMHKKSTGINMANDSVFKSELHKTLSESINSIKSDEIVFLRAKLPTKSHGTQNISVDFFWQNARDYIVRNEASLSASAIKTIVNDEINNSEIMFSKADFHKTAKYCISALSYDNSLAETWNLLGRSYRELTHYDMAVQCYEKAIKLTPNDAKLYNNAAIAYMLMEQFTDARKYAQKATKKAGANSSVYGSAWATAANIEAKAGNKIIAEKYFAKAKAAGYVNIDKLREIIDSCPAGNQNTSSGTKQTNKIDIVMICIGLFLFAAFCVSMTIIPVHTIIIVLLIVIIGIGKGIADKRTSRKK